MKRKILVLAAVLSAMNQESQAVESDNKIF